MTEMFGGKEEACLADSTSPECTGTKSGTAKHGG